MAKNSMTGGQETLPHPLNPSRKLAQHSDSDGYTETNPHPLFRQKRSAMGGKRNVCFRTKDAESRQLIPQFQRRP
ncbi:hypothetical protein GHA01_29070 [Novacetimonas hansenii]|uniref:Uncharacterized protein n=1 Tax=Novacetimonas hansenii TaxID=436 RepID=A0ABQ0SIF8_NOVHA|nr:hypothetical protein GHA01_29070 [Novacetimonas hansenii]